MNWMVFIVSLVFITALAAVFVVWRWKNCLRRREPMGQETTWVVYLPAAVVFSFVSDSMPELHLAVKLAALVIMFGLCALPVRAMITRYEKELEKAIESDEEARWR